MQNTMVRGGGRDDQNAQYISLYSSHEDLRDKPDICYWTGPVF